MKKIEYEGKEKVIHYCKNWENEKCAANQKEYSIVPRPRKECKFCTQRTANERNRQKAIDRQKAKQDETLRQYQIEENQTNFKDNPEPVKVLDKRTEELRKKTIRTKRSK